MGVSVRSLLFDKGEYIMKLSQKKWKSLISGVLLAASASSFLIAPVYAADYSKPLIGTLKKDSEILSPDGNTVTENDGKLIYDFQGKDHTFTITNKDGITARKDSVYNNVGVDGNYGTLHIYQTNDKSNAWAGVNGFTANEGTVIVNSNLDITATSAYSSVGIAAANKGNLIINGNVKMRKDDAENPWGIITKNVHGNVGPGGATSMGGDANYTGARWQPAGISVDHSRGDVPAYDLGTISLLGNSIRVDTPYREENFVEGFGKFIEPYYALASYGGTINVNVKNQEAQNGKVEMVGNVLAMKSSDEAGNAMVYQNGRLNIGLTTQDSSWKGVIDNAGTEKAGEVNLWLQNGAQWIYENASRKDGLDASNLPDYSRPYYEKYDGISHLSSLVGGKDKKSAGIIKINDSDPIHIANAEGVTKVWYEHDDATPGTIIGGDIKVFNAKTGTEMMLYTGNNGISKGFAEGDTAAEKNNVSEVLNSLAHKLWYMAGDSNLTGSVSIAEGLTASSVTMKTGNITFAEGGQGFYDYTPEKDDKTYATGPIVKSENIGETRESDVNGIVSVNVTEAQDGVSGNAPSAMYAAGDAVSPLVIDLQGHTLKLNANNQTANYVSTVYVDENKSMEIKDSKGNGVLKVSAGLGADGNADTKAKYVYGIRVGEGGNLTANTDVEIDGVKSSATQRAYGVYVSTKGNVVFEKDLSIKNVQTGNKVGPNTAGIYADSSSSADAPINITVKGNLNIENVLGSAIRALNTSTVSTAGATIKAADMSNGTDYSQYYALQANKGTINLNTGEGITAGILDVTGDMKVTDNKASVINVNMTKGSQWTGAVSNIPGSTYNAPAGQFNLTMADGSVWNHETGRSVDTLKTIFAGSNVSKLDASGVIYQNSDKGITVYDYSGDTTVVYGHDADNPQNITGGEFTVKTAADGSKITLVTDSQGINAGFEASDTATEKNNVKEVLNKLANKLFYTGYKDANLAGVVKIADGLTASSVSAIVKASGDITFSDGSNGTKKAGQGFYDYTPEEDKPDYKTGAITKSENISLNREVDDKGVAHINVTESNAGNNKFASAIYAGEETSPSKPMTINMSGKGLALNVAQTGGQAAAIYAGANTYIKVINPSAEQKLSINIVDTDKKNGYSAIYAANGKINVNTVKDADGKVTGAGNNKVDITGNIVTSVGAVNYVDCSTETEVNVGLTTKDSKLTGVVYNQFPEGGKNVSQKGDSKTFTGAANLWMQNGATWTNEQQGVLPSVWGGEQFKGSRVNKLAGGATAEAAGNIYQNDSNSLTIDNYSGVTNIIYAHGGDGTSYAAGDTVIKHAEAGSVVNMITSNQGVTDISAALNALAGKLTYLNYATANGSERNLNGYVKLAGGLTSDSVTMVTGDIRFSEETGKGSGTDNIKFADEPDNQTAKTFNSTLTGERLKDLEYVMGGVVKDGTYKFTENTAINVSGEGAKGMDFVKDTAVDASGKTLSVNVTEASKGNAGISQDVDVNSTIKADKLVIKLDSEKSGKGAQAIRQDKGNLTIDANVDIDVKGDNSTMGIYSHAGSTTVNGDVKVVLDGKRGGFNEYGAAGIYAHAGYGGAVGGTVNVNGNVDISGVGNGLFANIGGATINVNGGKINIVDTDKKNGYSAIYATCGAINMNTVKDAAGKVIGAGNNKVDITGNVVVSVGAVNYVDCCTETEVNLGLTTKDSKLTGVVYNQFPEGGKTVSQRGDSKTFTGAANLWLQNGALWTNEQQGELPSVWGGEQFKGSFVTNLVGGTNADNAGQIYQKDSNNLTIDTLSGSIRVIYDHEFEDAETRAAGDKKIVYKAGDTVINNAKDGSQVIMATGSNGINTFDKDSVEDAFKGLANKLIYKDAEKNPGNLKAELQLGGGLTGSNVSWSGDIEWDGNNGSYKLESAEQSIKLLYDEDAVSKDTRAAIMSGMVGWRNAATDTYRARAGAYGEDNQGVWARTWGGQNKYTGNNTSFKNSYWAGQVGYDKTLANGWNVGVAFDYMTGDDSYYAGSGDTKTYTLGLYGSKEISNNEFIDLTAKVGRVSNDFETKDILGRTVKGDYKANGFSFSGQYSKRFGSEAAGYFEPQAQLTIGRLGSSDFDSTGTLEGHISQDSFTSIVGRLGIEAGQASDHGRYFARLSLSHEFAGDVDTHFSDSSATMTREFNLDGTWCDLTVGGTYDLSDKVSFYGDVTKTLTGDYKQDWKVNAGLRFTF